MTTTQRSSAPKAWRPRTPWVARWCFVIPGKYQVGNGCRATHCRRLCSCTRRSTRSSTWTRISLPLQTPRRCFSYLSTPQPVQSSGRTGATTQGKKRRGRWLGPSPSCCGTPVRIVSCSSTVGGMQMGLCWQTTLPGVGSSGTSGRPSSFGETWTCSFWRGWRLGCPSTWQRMLAQVLLDSQWATALQLSVGTPCSSCTPRGHTSPCFITVRSQSSASTLASICRHRP
mmetsp:Transcript_77296/g.250096  ORF Transcript_77296/g.250096 Transcript_77296/m.250096 type:complete len:228 (+) Transcript_77296:428-1111(+)